MPAKTLILLVGSCVAWIALIATALVAFSGLAVSIGWIVAGVFVCAAVVWALLMSGEIRRAIDLSDFLIPGNRGENEALSTTARPRTAMMTRPFNGRRVKLMGRRPKNRTRKPRPSFPKFAGSPVIR